MFAYSFHAFQPLLGHPSLHRGDMHDFLGVTFDFSTKKNLKIRMDGYVREVVEEADLRLKNKRDQANTPASMDLVRIDST